MSSKGTSRKSIPYRRFKVPDGMALERGLGAVLQPGSDAGLELLDRRLHARASTFPLEIVKCRLHSGRVVDVVCKYSGEHKSGRHGHKGGVDYEAAVYRDLLVNCGMPVVACRGTYRDADSGWDWLVLDYLDGASTSGETENGLFRAAEWLGRFHARHEGSAQTPASLKRYDPAYFESWATRTIEFTRAEGSTCPWLQPLCEAYLKRVSLLFDSPLTVVHGEYYSKNVLIVEDVAYPVDWESAAIGPGVIDIASLTEKWPEWIVNGCLTRYAAARWPDGAPQDLPRQIEVARLFWLLRWVGDIAQKASPRLAKRIPRLEAFARSWNIIKA